MNSTDYDNWKARIADHDDSYLRERLEPIGITDRYNWFDFKLDAGHCYFQPDERGHIDIFYPSVISRQLQGYWKQTKNKKDEHFIPTTRKRYRKGFEELNGEGKKAKYKLPHGSSSVLWIGKNMLGRIRAKEQIPMIIVTEGEFKTAVGDRLGLPVLGTGGIQNFGDAETQQLLEELLHITRTCGTLRLCLLYDSDLFDLSVKIEEGSDPTQRSRGTFFSAAKRFKERCQLAGLDAYLAWPKPGEKKMGLDDLVIDLIGEAPAELLKLESYTPVDAMTVMIWSPDCVSHYASMICKQFGWDPQQLFQAPRSEKKLNKAQRRKLAVSWRHLQPAISWLAGGRRIMRELIKLVTAYGGESANFVCVKAADTSDHQLKQLWALDSPLKFWKMHHGRLKEWKSFKWGRDTYNIVNDEPVLEDLDVSLTLESHGNQLYRRSDKGGKSLVGTFTFRALWHIKGDREGYIINALDEHGSETTLVLPSGQITNLHAFETKMLEHGMSWMATPQEHKHAVREAVRLVPQAVSIEVLGWQPRGKFWAWSNGIFDGKKFHKADEMGFVKTDDTNYFLPAASSMYEVDDQAFKRARMVTHLDQRTPATFTRWYELAARVYGYDAKTGLDRALIALAFVTATAFADVVRDRLDFFPILFLFGPPQMGKSTYATSCLSFFGKPLPRVNLEASTTTIVGLQRVMASFRNVPTHLDEVSARVRPELLDQMKNIFDGIGGTQGVKTPGTEVRTYATLSTAIASGQHLPSHDPALVRRCIMVEFGKRPKPSIQELQNMDELRAMQKRGLTDLIHEILQHRSDIERLWTMTFTRVYTRLLEMATNQAAFEGRAFTTTDSVLQCHAALITPLVILAPRLDNGVLVDETSIITCALALLPLHTEASEAADEGETFWHYLDLARERGWIHGTGRDFLIEEGKIYLRFRRCHTAYQRIANKEVGGHFLPEASMKIYLRQSAAYIGKEKRRLHPAGDRLEVEVFDLGKVEFTE